MDYESSPDFPLAWALDLNVFSFFILGEFSSTSRQRQGKFVLMLQHISYIKASTIQISQVKVQAGNDEINKSRHRNVSVSFCTHSYAHALFSGKMND